MSVMRDLLRYSRPIVRLIFILLILNTISVVFAQTSTVTVTPEGIPDPVEVGQVFQFEVEYTCSSSTNDCERSVIEVVIPSDVVNAANFQLITDPNGRYVQDGPVFTRFNATGGYTETVLTLSNTVGANPCTAAGTEPRCLSAGLQAELTVQVGIADEANDFGATFPLSFISINPDNGNTAAPPVVETVTITPPVFDWAISKRRVFPDASIAPAPDDNYSASYNITVTPEQLGNFNITNLVITDTLPAGAIAVGSSLTPNETLPATGAITWTIASRDFTDGPLTIRVDVAYPTASFVGGDPAIPNDGTIVDNQASFTTDYSGGSESGICGTPCAGDELDSPVGTVNLGKSLVQGPVGVTGQGRFNLAIDTLGSNANVPDVVIIDVLQDQAVAPNTASQSDLFQLIGVRPGQWTDDIYYSNLQATVSYSTDTTRAACAVTTDNTVLGTYDGTSGAIVNFPGSPANITCVAIEFSFTDITGNVVTGLPANFEFNSPFQSIFEPIATQYDVPPTFTGPIALPYTSARVNCLDANFTNPATAAGDTATQACDNNSVEVISDANSNESVDSSKTVSPSTIRPESPNIPDNNEYSTFTLEVNITERTSDGAEIDEIIIADVIPVEFDETSLRVDSITISNDLNSLGGALSPTITSQLDTSNPARNDGIQFDYYTEVRTQDWDNNAGTPDEARTVVVFRFGDDNGTPNQLNYSPPDNGNQRITIELGLILRRYIPDGTYSNTAYIFIDDGANLICEDPSNTNVAVADVFDIDDDGDTTERQCQDVGDYDVPTTLVIDGQKWIRNETRFDAANPSAFTDIVSDTNPGPVPATGSLASCPLVGDGLNNTISGLTDGASGGLDNEQYYNRFACVSEGIVGDEVTYRLTIQNFGNDYAVNYALYDLLPHEGDVGVSQTEFNNAGSRGSSWRTIIDPAYVAGNPNYVAGIPIQLVGINNEADPTLTNLLGSLPLGGSTIVTAANWQSAFTIQYNDTFTPCRPQVYPGLTPCNNTWSATPTINTRSFRILLNAGFAIAPGAQLDFVVRARIPSASNFVAAPATDFPTNQSDLQNVPQTGTIAWNNYAHAGAPLSDPADALTGVDVIKVGIRIPEFVSVGNRIWYDLNNNRQYNSGQGETPIANVTVSLYTWTGTNVGTLVDTTATDADGYYIFNLDPPGLDLTPNPEYIANQQYVVVVDAANFTNPATLLNYLSSSGSQGVNYNNNDTRDRGVDTFLVGGLAAGGIRSEAFTFSTGMGTGENDPNPASTNDPLSTTDNVNDPNDDAGKGDDFGPEGRGNLGQDDNNSNLRVDFSFTLPLSIGNRVWLDDGGESTGTFTPANKNNGVFDVGETPIAGVDVELYVDTNGNGVYDVGTDQLAQLLNTATASYDIPAQIQTDANGYYIFVGLRAGDYFVHLPSSNFTVDTANPTNDGVLAFHVSSTGWTTQQQDLTTINPTFVDSNDNGVDTVLLTTNGITSQRVRLTLASETLSDTDKEDDGTPTNQPDEGDGYIGGQPIRDENSDLTVDFGFLLAPMSIGNVVWQDSNNNGIRDGVGTATVEAPISGVRVNLYRDANGDGNPDDLNGSGTFDAGDILAFTTTDANGYYLFDGYVSTFNADVAGADRDLPAGRYILEIDPSEFIAGGDLIGYFSSDDPATAGTDNTDSDDDGAGDDSNSPYDGTAGNDRIRSATAILIPYGEPTAETDNAGVTMPEHGTSQTAYGVSTDGSRTSASTAIADNQSDRTWDFGFYKKFSVGNRVWYDVDRSTTDSFGTARPGDGRFSADGSGTDDTGVNGVVIELYRVGQTAGVDIPVARTATDADGYYLFDETNTLNAAGADDPNNTPIYAGTYYVHIPAGEFATGEPLYQYYSSDGGGIADGANEWDDPDLVDSNIDTDDNGNNAVSPATTGVSSNTFTLSYEAEPTNNSAAGNTTDVIVNEERDFDGTVTDRDGDGIDADDDVYGVGVEDDNNNMTIDFSFYRAMSIGNRVWFDQDRSGTINNNFLGTDENATGGIDGVRMFLFRTDAAGNALNPDGSAGGSFTADGGGNGIPDDAIAVDTTANGGYYLFDAWVAGGVDAGGAEQLLQEGFYVVVVDPAEFAATGDLEDYISTITNVQADGSPLATGSDNQRDSDDNGVDTEDNGALARSDVRSVPIELTFNSEPSPSNTPDDTDLDTSLAAEDREGIGVKDENGDMTVDFGFFIPYAIGNRVWFDDAATNSQQIHPDANGDGIPDGPEAATGIPNVQVSLFLVPAGYIPGNTPIDTTGATTSFITDGNGDGIPDGAFATTTTNANGYYIFDYLPQGNYVVQVDPMNFNANTGVTTNTGGALYNNAGSFPYFSSEDTNTSFIPANADTDLRDDGIDENQPQINGVRSNRYTLSRDAEPSTTVGTDDRDLDATDGEGRNGELDENANMTVDFEFNISIPMSIGNRVFYDYNNNGIYDNDDVGVVGATLRLYAVDAAGNVLGGGQLDNPADALQTEVTGVDGRYIFDGLPSGLYRVVLVEENFRNGALIDNYFSTTNVDGRWVDDNGDSAVNTGFENGGTANIASQADNLTPENQGIISTVITLTPSTEPENETFKFDTGTDGIGDDGQPNIEDSNGDMTQDFGVYKPQSIGNRVWFDSNNDGVISTGELGAAGVTVSLYVDEGNGVYDGTESLAQLADITTRTVVPAQEVTDANGYYLFDNVPPGRYFVVVEDTNFTTGQPLDGLSSTITGADNPNFTPPAGFTNPANDDSNDNGDDLPVAGDIHSGLIDLTRPYDDLITTEPDLSGNTARDGASGIGRNGETDNNSDITIDFGFTSPNMSLGNKVWFDEDGNGLIDSVNAFGNDESAGINGVVVSLYRDANNNGLPDGPAIATDTTANGGYYLFENLSPGQYLVGINNANFTAGQPLAGLVSTLTGADNTGDDPTTDPTVGGTFTNPADDDSNDNGRDLVNATYGVLSNTVTLTRDLERSGEVDKEAGVLDGTGVDLNDSDLTVDFGFFEPLSLGNRVWLDTDDSGFIDNGEVGVAGVTVYLFRTDGAGNIIDADGDGTGSSTDDTNADNIPDDAIATDVTDANGYYLFDRLPPGTYIVAVGGQNFVTGGSLIGTTSSSVDGVPTIDSDDDGILADGINNVLSAEVTLHTRASGIDEPTGETDLSGNTANDGPNSRGRNGETDANSNLAVDFGFTPTAFYSIGNRVWIDNGGGTPANARNGFFDVGELGIAGVRVSLYRDANGDNRPDGAAIATTTTGANGDYLFDRLSTGTYIVGLDRSNFITTGVLVGYASTIANADNGTGTPTAQDNNDNRFNPIAGTALDPTYGFYSIGYTLDGTEPTNETSPNNTTGNPDITGTNPSGGAIADANSDLSVDFGVYRSMTIGNRVWFDLNNNGLIDGGENGIAGVELVLFRDENNDGIPDDIDGSTTFGDNGDIVLTTAGTPYTDITDSRGYYLFNDLVTGRYIVAVRDTNFTAGNALSGFASSTGVLLAPADSADNGIDTAVNGHIISNTITLTPNAAPTGESDTSGNTADGPNFRGVNNESDNNSDLTWDFGFFSQPMSLGNRVWLDDGGASAGSLIPANVRNGIADVNEPGIANVLVELFADTDNNGTPDGSRIATDTTDVNGYYLFDGLPPGSYIVRLAPSNFSAGNALDGLFSTLTNVDPDTGNAIGAADEDINDNGIDNTNPETNGILSGTIVLESTSSEPLGESDLSGDAGDDDGSNNFRGTNGETDADSNLTVDFGLATSFDWGDAPDSYGTNATANDTNPATPEGIGASHRIISQLRIGAIIDDEIQGVPTTGADGDDSANNDDEDGLTFPPSIIPETTFDLEVSLFNNTGRNATFVVWFDWNGNGIFEVSSDVNGDSINTPEAYTVTVPSSPTSQIITIPITVPAQADIATVGTTYVRARLTTDSLTTSEPTGSKSNGEVEDYQINIDPPGVFISKSDGAVAIVAGQSTTYTIIVENSASAPNLLNQNFVDDVPVFNPNGFIETSVSWTCTASNGASCLAGAIVTNRSDADSGNNPWEISEFVDLPAAGRLVYTVTGTLRASATGVGGITIDNTATISGVSDTDENSIVFDPPRGRKSGVVNGNNVISWTMEWFNSGDGNPATNNRQFVTITDTLPANQTFLGNLVCTAFDSDPVNNGAAGVGTETTSCTEVAGTITWTGYIDEDFGVPAGDNSLIISFDVTVAGDGIYTNVATLDDGNPATTNVVASATVGINTAVPDVEPEFIAQDPVIVKLVDPLLAQPDEEVVWTIEVTNPNPFALNDISVTDAIPDALEIISATASFGSPTISGQNVTYSVATLNAGQTVTVTINTRIRPDAVAQVITNVVVLDNTGAEADAAVLTVSALPETGETPWWRSIVGFGTITSIFLLSVLTIALRKKSQGTQQ